MDRTLFFVCCIWLVISPKLVYSDVYNLVLGKQINNYRPENEVSFPNQAPKDAEWQRYENEPLLENSNHYIMINAPNGCNDNGNPIPLQFQGEPNLSDNQNIIPLLVLDNDNSNIQSVPNSPINDQNYANQLMTILQILHLKEENQMLKFSAEDKQKILVPNSLESLQKYVSPLMNLLLILSRKQENQYILSLPEDDQMHLRLLMEILGRKQESFPIPSSVHISILIKILQILNVQEVKTESAENPYEEGDDITSFDFQWNFSTTPAPLVTEEFTTQEIINWDDLWLKLDYYITGMPSSSSFN
ncbi:hypothetical protein ACLKA6_003933 [Drosophila palustris]